MGERLNPRARRGLALFGVAGVLVAVAALYWLRPPAAPVRQAAVPANTAPLPADVTDWQFADRDHGWVLLNSQTDPIGRLFATGDGGAHWRALASLGSLQPYSLRFFDARHAVIGVRDPAGRLSYLFSSDGGVSWRGSKSPPFALEAGRVVVADAETAYLFTVVGLFATTDGAQTWQQRDATGLPVYARPLGFRDALNGWATTPGPTLYRTQDGGRTWFQVALSLPPQTDAVSIVFAGASAMLVTSSAPVNHPAVYPSPDGGETWEPARPAFPDLVAPQQCCLPAFVDHDHWFTGGAEILWSTSDAGQNWTLLATRRPGALTFGEIRFTTPTDGWSLTYGQAGPVLLRTADGGFQWTEVKVPRLG